jgi:hypothetical protein
MVGGRIPGRDHADFDRHTQYLGERSPRSPPEGGHSQRGIPAVIGLKPGGRDRHRRSRDWA